MYLGIDISKDNLDCHKLNDVVSEAKQFKNSKKGIRALAKWAQDCDHIVMEATGVYWQACAYGLHVSGSVVSVVNPAQVKRFGQSKLMRGKTDKMDAKLLADYAQKMDLKVWEPPTETCLELQILVRERESLVSQLTQVKNQYHAHKRRENCPEKVLDLCKQHIEFLKSLIKVLEKDISVLCKETQTDSYFNLKSIPGIGVVTASVFLAETYGLKHFHESKQLTAYTGIAPAPNQSGKSKRKSSISKIGNKRIRTAFYMAALQARKSSVFKDLYDRVLKRSSSIKVALIAVARKLLIIAFTLVKSNQAFDPNYLSNSS